MQAHVEHPGSSSEECGFDVVRKVVIVEKFSDVTLRAKGETQDLTHALAWVR